LLWNFDYCGRHITLGAFLSGAHQVATFSQSVAAHSTIPKFF
jgi:hypothetical protein